VARVCEICGKKPAVGRSYARRGLPKRVGGIGLKITGKTLRRFQVNLQKVRVVDENGAACTKRVCARCLKTGLRKGTLSKSARGAHRRYLEEKAKEGAAS